MCSSFSIQNKVLKPSAVRIEQLLRTFFHNYRKLPIVEMNNLIFYLFLSQFEKIKKDGYPLSRLSIAVKLLPGNKKERSCRMSCSTAAKELNISWYVLLARQYFEVVLQLSNFSMAVLGQRR